MTVFSSGTDYLEWRVDNETIRIVAMGDNALRVVASPNGEVDLTSPALIGPTGAAVVTIEDDRATIQNGGLLAVVDGTDNYGGRLSFYDARGRLLIQEASDGGALRRRRGIFSRSPAATGG